jgi:hypothetical protein
VLLFNDIKFYIVTNISAPIPADLKEHVFLIESTPEHAAMGICIKLFTIDYVQTQHTLFIDADCLCYGDLTSIFEAANPMSVTVAGNIVPVESWMGIKYKDEVKTCFRLDNVIRFNGGFYYIKNDRTAREIFSKAQDIHKQYDYGYDSAGKQVNEEAQMSIAMTLNNQKPIPDNGTVMTDMFTDRRPQKLNVLTQTRVLKNPEASATFHRPWYPKQYSPVILHFGGANLNSYPYNSQKILLRLHRYGLPVWVATLFVDTVINIPYRTWHTFKMVLGRLKNA